MCNIRRIMIYLSYSIIIFLRETSEILETISDSSGPYFSSSSSSLLPDAVFVGLSSWKDPSNLCVCAMFSMTTAAVPLDTAEPRELRAEVFLAVLCFFALCLIA